MKVTDEQLVEALTENGHEPEAEALAEKIAEQNANPKPVDMNDFIRASSSRQGRPAA